MDEAVMCPTCGCQTASKQTDAADAPSTGFAVLGFFLPVVGLILYLVWKDTTPLKAKSVGKGALIGAIVSVVGTVIYAVAVGSLLGSALYYYY